MFLKQTAAKTSAVLSALCLLGDAKRLHVGRGLEGGGAGSRRLSRCNALTSVKKLDGLDAEEMLCLA